MHTTVFSPHSDAYLANHEFQDRSNDCGPYSAALVIRALSGVQVHASELARQMNAPVWRFPFPVIRRIPAGATFPWGMTDVLRRHGLEARWQICAGRAQLLDGLRRGDALILVLAEWRILWLHIMTLAAFDTEYGWGFVNTAYPQRMLFWLRDDVFHARWNAAGRMLVTARRA